MTDREELIRYALGEMSDAERRAINDLVAREPATAGDLRAIQRLVEALSRGRAMEERFDMSRAKREDLYKLLDSRERGMLGRAINAIDTIVAALVSDSWLRTGIAPAMRGEDGSRRFCYSVPRGSIDVRLEPSPARLAAYECVGQICGIQPTTGRWRDIDAGIEHELIIDEDGFFECTVGPGRHQIEVEGDGIAIVTPVISHPGTDV